MRKAMMEYHEEVLNPALKWLSRHWKGYIALSVVVYALCYGWVLYMFYSEEIKGFFNRIKEKFTGRKEEA